MRHAVYIAIVLSVLSLSSRLCAYTETDKVNVVLKFGSQWEIVGKQTDAHDALVAYFNSGTGSKGETILQTMTVKEANKSAVMQVVQLYNDMKSGITQRGCSITDLQQITPNDAVVHEWSTTFQCKMPAQTGTMIIADADPVNLYTFTYNSKTDADDGTGKRILKDNIQLCYKFKSCYSL